MSRRRRAAEQRRRAEVARDLQRQLEDRERAVVLAIERLQIARGVAPAPEAQPEEAPLMVPNLMLAPRGYIAADRIVFAEPAPLLRPFTRAGFPTAEAEVKARELLRSLLRPAQREHFDAEGWVREIGGLSGREYWIAPHFAGNVMLLDGWGHHGQRLCIHPPRPTPIGDVMASQVLSIRGAETLFRNLARTTGPIDRSPLVTMRQFAAAWPQILEGRMWGPRSEYVAVFPDAMLPFPPLEA